MKISFSKIFVITAMSALFAGAAQSQDIHFSQFYETTELNNPALVGVFSEDYKAGVIYRTQWGSVTTPFQTTLMNAETKVKLNDVNDYLSFGLLAYFDKAGDINFQTFGLYPTLNYNKSLNDKYSSYLNVGFTAGFIQRSLDVSKMTFDNQYQNGVILPSAPDETIPNPSLTYWDLGAGVSFNSSFDEENKVNYFVGAAAYHFTSPKTSFYTDQQARLGMRWDGNAGLDLNFDEQYGVQLNADVMEQAPYQEIIVGGLVKWNRLNSVNSQPFTLYLGCFYRLQDAIIPTVKLRYKHASLGVSYDVNNSSLSSVSSGHGGFEISLFYASNWIGGYDDKHLCPRF